MPLIATPGATDANSYVTLARANELLAMRLFTTTWTNTSVTDSNREAALQWATALLDAHYRWLGTATYPDQALGFPRSGLLKPNGQPLDSTIIPIEIERATSEFAMRLIASDLTTVNSIAARGITELTAGPVKMKFEEGFQASIIPSPVNALIPLSWYVNDVTGAVTSLIESV